MTLNRKVFVAVVLILILAQSALHLHRPAVPAAVDWQWAGAVTADGFRLTARLTGDAAVRLALAADSAFSQPVYTALQQAQAASDWVIAFDVTGLQPATEYYYTLEVDGALNLAGAGRLRTFPVGAASFKFAFSADAVTGSNAPVYDSLAALGPDFTLITGDLFYADIAANDPALYRAAYYASLRQPRQANLRRAAPLIYIWDDHDYSTNNSDSTSPARPAARQSYQALTPHYPLAEGRGDVPIYQAFSVGRVRFILTDLRSERSPDSTPDGPAKSMLGARQKAWLQQELLAASGRYPLIVWVSSVPWIGPAETGGDYWGGFSTERAEIARFIEENNIQGLVMLSGDAHMAALDDGRNNRYGPSGAALFPVLHAAPLQQNGSIKGGPYSHGAFAPASQLDGQFAWVEVQDSGEQVCLDYSARRLPNGATATVELIHWNRCFSAPGSLPLVQVASFQSGASPSLDYAGAGDTAIAQAAPETNYGASAVCGADGDDPPNTASDQATLLYWDLSSLPPRAVALAAEVVLAVSNASANAYPLAGLRRPWDELQATWLDAQTRQPWEQPGALGSADRWPAALGSLGPAQTGLRQVTLNTAGLLLVQQWLADPSTNYGLALSSAANTDGVDFACRETGIPWQRPRLNLSYWTPTTATYLPLVRR